MKQNQTQDQNLWYSHTSELLDPMIFCNKVHYQQLQAIFILLDIRSFSKRRDTRHLPHQLTIQKLRWFRCSQDAFLQARQNQQGSALWKLRAPVGHNSPDFPDTPEILSASDARKTLLQIIILDGHLPASQIKTVSRAWDYHLPTQQEELLQ